MSHNFYYSKDNKEFVDTPVANELRNNQCNSQLDSALSAMLWSRIKDIVPTVTVHGHTRLPYGTFQLPRVCKYDPGQFFRAHFDQRYTNDLYFISHCNIIFLFNLSLSNSKLYSISTLISYLYSISSDVETFGQHKHSFSLMTMVVYLNEDFEGGETAFYVPQEENRRVPKRVVVAPKRGSAVLFLQQKYLHEGLELFGGAKYIIQTSVMYDHPDSLIIQDTLVANVARSSFVSMLRLPPVQYIEDLLNGKPFQVVSAEMEQDGISPQSYFCRPPSITQSVGDTPPPAGLAIMRLLFQFKIQPAGVMRNQLAMFRTLFSESAPDFFFWPVLRSELLALPCDIELPRESNALDVFRKMLQVGVHPSSVAQQMRLQFRNPADIGLTL